MGKKINNRILLINEKKQIVSIAHRYKYNAILWMNLKSIKLNRRIPDSKVIYALLSFIIYAQKKKKVKPQ